MYHHCGRVQPTSTPQGLIIEWEGYELMKVSFTVFCTNLQNQHRTKILIAKRKAISWG